MSDLDASIKAAAESSTGGYVATPDGPIHAGVARIFLALDKQPQVFDSEWFAVLKESNDSDVYRLAAFTDPDREIVKWALQDGVHDLTFGLEELRELRDLLNRVLSASGQETKGDEHATGS